MLFSAPALRISLLAACSALFAASREAQVAPDAALLRFPDVSATEIVFRYDGDLWLVAKEGGVARRLTTVEGNESLPRFSPDGSEVAFMGGYEGGTDLYRLRIAAGRPVRVTHHPGQEMLNDWTPDGEALFYWSSEASGLPRAARILQVDADGGQPEPLPVPYGTFGALDATGTWLAYTPGSREFRTWKRYQGGMAQDIWLFNLKTHESRRLTDHAGTDAAPMWHGRQVVFLSDRGPYGRMNLYAHDLDFDEVRRLTDFRDTDVKFPAMGPQDVVFTAGGKLFRYEFETERRVEVRVELPGERRRLVTQTLEVEPFLAGASPGPSGTRILVEARGELFDVPVEEGVTRNLTRTDGVAEREPAWSPDGRWMAYFSDRTGEYELTVRRIDGAAFDGADETNQRTLTSLGEGWKSELAWSPDSERLRFATNDGGLHVVQVATGEHSRIHTNLAGNPVAARWAPDSNWLAWSHQHPESRLDALYLHDLAAGATHVVTSGMFDDSNPVFDRNGDWLYFHSSREFSPIYEDLGVTWIYTNSRTLLAVPLRGDVENPWLPKNPSEEIESESEEEAGDDEDDEGESDDEESDDEAESDDETSEEDDDAKDADAEPDEPLVIAIEGFEARALLLPVAAGNLANLEGGEGGVYFVERPRTGTTGDEPVLRWMKLGEDEPETILDPMPGGYVPTAKGDRALVLHGSKLGWIELEPKAKLEAIALGQMRATIDPRAEWPQLIADVYRLFRDFFYEEGLHGVDWAGLRDRYTAALADATSREDVHWLIGEMISELNVGHAYNRQPPAGGFESSGEARAVGLLGAEWSVADGAFRIERILGADYDVDARSPLAVHGVEAAVGDYLLAVNGLDVDPTQSVYAALEGTAGQPTELVFNSKPTRDGNERTVLVEPLASEGALRYRDWVAEKRARVEELGGGRIGYVHVPDTGRNGQNELMRQFLGQMHKDALIVDERWNGGGQIPQRFIELLHRPLRNFWAIRHGEDWTWPPVGHHGPKAMLINGWSGSGGDALPYYFRQSELGPLIGRRTWGGLVGISGNPSLIDGASPSVPRFAFYELDGTWGVEGYGVEPDIEVMDDPAKMLDGGDPQLEAAVTHLLGELETWPGLPRNRPAGPDRAGAGGVTPEDR
ncbi:MAG: PDZ domain-containing protein [Planctomycetota bacterium]